MQAVYLGTVLAAVLSCVSSVRLGGRGGGGLSVADGDTTASDDDRTVGVLLPSWFEQISLEKMNDWKLRHARWWTLSAFMTGRKRLFGGVMYSVEAV